MRISELPRPSPERLLKQVQAEESKQRGAKLKIFLGYAPGVGKSYRMLDEARRRHERGEDVVVGAVQGKQSEDIQALLRKLELISPLQTPEGQAVDLDAILRRAPQVCIIDPLAAQNPRTKLTEFWGSQEKRIRRSIWYSIGCIPTTGTICNNSGIARRGRVWTWTLSIECSCQMVP
jgi:two-component system sensor histidine kinase KdpD